MKNQNSQHFLKDALGNRVPVSDEIYAVCQRYAEKEDYLTRRLKEESFVYDPAKRIATFLPSREDSYERLIEAGEEFACDQSSVEERAIASILTENLMRRMTDEEKAIIIQSYVCGKSDQEAADYLGIHKEAYKSRRQAVIAKCRKFFDDSS